MTYDIDDDSQEELVSEIAPDTPLPKDLIEHLESRKQHRKCDFTPCVTKI